MVNKPEVDCAREEIFVISSVEGELHLKLTEGVSIITDPLLKNDVPEGVAVMLVVLPVAVTPFYQ